MENIVDYSNRVKGKKVGAGQCGDLMKDWFITETGRQQLANDLDEWGYFPGTDAYTSWNVATQTNWAAIGFDVINTPSFSQLRAGDIFFISTSKVPGSGHTGIVVSTAGNNVTTLEQNILNAQYAQLLPGENSWSWYGFDKIVRPKGGAPSPGDGGKATSTGINGLNLIKQFEGCRLTAYDIGDGKITIGWGHAENKGNTNLVAGVTTWTQAQADKQLVTDLKVYENAINSYFTRTFNQNQFDAMASFTYNLGAGIFAQDGWEKNASNSYITASFPNYINKGSAFEEGLKKRRQAEVNLFNTPVSGGSGTDKGEIEMYLIMTIDTKNWYVSNGVQCKWIKSERFLNNFQNDFGKLNLPVDKMYSTELYKEFPKDTIIVK